MATVRHIIVCEGESEHTYLLRLQSFLDRQELPQDTYETPIRFISPTRSISKTGSFGKIVQTFRTTRKENRKRTISVWADFDLYCRNDNGCADSYKSKLAGIPGFYFSFHNFEDFYSLHFDGAQLAGWLRLGSNMGRNHFTTPLHSDDYLPEIRSIFLGCKKNDLPSDFVSWESLRNLKANLHHVPMTSNPHGLTGIHSFARFLIQEIDRAYPGMLL